MRSRYSAFCTRDAIYLHRTWAKTKQSHHKIEDIKASFSHTHWCRLEIVSASDNGVAGQVEFNAFYVSRGTPFVLHETSTFLHEENSWRYESGEIQVDSGKLGLGRNAPCICLSGKKFKRCCATKGFE